MVGQKTSWMCRNVWCVVIEVSDLCSLYRHTADPYHHYTANPPSRGDPPAPIHSYREISPNHCTPMEGASRPPTHTQAPPLYLNPITCSGVGSAPPSTEDSWTVTRAMSGRRLCPPPPSSSSEKTSRSSPSSSSSVSLSALSASQ